MKKKFKIVINENVGVEAINLTDAPIVPFIIFSEHEIKKVIKKFKRKRK